MNSKNQGNVFGSVGKQFGGIATATVKRVVREPMEVLKTAVGAKSGEEAMPTHNEAGEQAMEQATPTASPTHNGSEAGRQSSGPADSSAIMAGKQPAQPKGFRTREDYEKYTEGSGNRDKLELRMMRRKMAQEWGVGEGVEAGMEKVRRERDAKEDEKDQVEEQEKQQAEAMKYEKEKAENEQVKAAKDGASAEKRGKMG